MLASVLALTIEDRMAQTVAPKQPNEILDYDIECDGEMSYGDAIESATAYAYGPDDELFIETVGPVNYSPTVAKVRLSGGTNLNRYKVTLLIITRDGLLIESEFNIRIKDD